MQTLELVKSGKHYLHNRLAAEFCLLQLRFCCEYIAIGFVAIHTDVPQTKLFKEWNAGRIVKTFEELKSEFFPESVRSERQPDGKILQVPIRDGLTRDELVSMYNLMGDLLHSGTFKDFKFPEQPRAFSFEMLHEFISKMMQLLNDHIYYLDGRAKMIRVIMNDVAKGGGVSMNELERSALA